MYVLCVYLDPYAKEYNGLKSNDGISEKKRMKTFSTKKKGFFFSLLHFTTYTKGMHISFPDDDRIQPLMFSKPTKKKHLTKLYIQCHSTDNNDWPTEIIFLLLLLMHSTTKKQECRVYLPEANPTSVMRILPQLSKIVQTKMGIRAINLSKADNKTWTIFSNECPVKQFFGKFNFRMQKNSLLRSKVTRCICWKENAKTKNNPTITTWTMMTESWINSKMHMVCTLARIEQKERKRKMTKMVKILWNKMPKHHGK